MNRIVPTILTNDKQELTQLIQKAKTFTDYVQIDVMDGKFAPTKSIGAKEVKEVNPGIRFEVDLMVEDPESYFKDFADAGADEVFWYVETTGVGTNWVIDAARSLGLRAGLAMLPETPLTAVAQFADRLDSLRFFSGHLGYYGGEFNKSVLDKVREARAKWPNKIFGIDGGVALENIAEIKSAGINYFAVGSRIMKTDNPASAYNKFAEAVL